MKIGITGSHGVGKTTLLNDLKESSHFELPVINEVARKMILEGFQMGTESFQRAVTNEQIRAENSMESFISDRTVFDNLAYSKVISEELYKELKDLCCNQTYDKIFFVPIEFDLEDDGVRFTDRKFQLDIQNSILQILSDTSTPFEIVSGSREQRVSKIINSL